MHASLPVRLSTTLALTAALVAQPQHPAANGETLLLQEPTISAQHIVFVYAEDLWIVGRQGGEARRLTSSLGAERSPKLSPDGRWVAFTGEYEGNADVYLLSIDGGMPRRLTWHPEPDVVEDWHPDGKRVLFGSRRASQPRESRLFLVDIQGGTPQPLPVPRANHASYNQAGTKIAYTPVPDAFRSWKRYRGGRTTPVWIYDVQSHEVEVVPHVNASDTWPCWIRDAVYFASDRDDHMNVYRFRPGAKEVEQLTRFTDFDVRNMDATADAVVFEQAGALNLLDPDSGAIARLTIQVRADGLAALPRWQEVKGFVRGADVAPNGKRSVFEARGEIISVPREHGDARVLTQSPGVHDRDPAWSPDGEQIAWFSDASGEYQLLVGDCLGRGEPKAYDLGGGFYYGAQWSPDGKHVAFSDKTNRIALVTLASGEVTEVARVQGSLGVVGAELAWSADSKWIAFEDRNPLTAYDRIALFELATGRVTHITDGFGAAASPAFSDDGKYLFFQATVDSGPQRFGLDMSASAARDAASNLYVVVLQKKGANPLGPKSDEATAAGDDDEDREEPVDAGAKERGDADEEKPRREPRRPKKPPETIDIDGIDQRILALPIKSGRYSGLACAERRLLFVARPRDGEPELQAFDFKERKATTVLAGVQGFRVSADGRSLLLQDKSGWALTDGKGKERKPLKIDEVKVRVDPVAEWPQILREAWRIERDYFYDPDMHGIDWPAMWTRWSAFLPHVKHRADLNVLLAEMIGELACGHNYVGGGETPPAPVGVAVGLLGADFVEAGGRHRIAEIYRGQNWNPGLRAPLTEPGVDARVGDYVIAVNGRPVHAADNIFAVFDNTADRRVELTLAATPDGADARTMTVVPVASEGALRQRSWVEANRRRVDELSGGRLAYIYMPNTGDEGMTAFDRDFYSQLDKEGLILDERFNAGGKVADYVIEVLSRQVMCYWLNREQWLAQTPFGTFEGPKVMIINETAGSGGDAMPWLFKQAGLGPLVGTRTWGGLVGISGYPPLMDGGRVTAASFGVMDREGNWSVENIGVAPDHEVVQWPKDVIAGGDPQLEKAVALAMAALEKRTVQPRPGYKPPARR